MHIFSGREDGADSKRMVVDNRDESEVMFLDGIAVYEICGGPQHTSGDPDSYALFEPACR